MDFEETIHAAGFSFCFSTEGWLVFINEDAGLVLEYNPSSKSTFLSQVVAGTYFMESCCSELEVEI